MHYEILETERRALLPFLTPLKTGFYLAGGTALALQIGHRESVDFDFFTEKDFAPDQLFQNLQTILTDHRLQKTHEAKNTLYIVSDETTLFSFITDRHPLIEQAINEPFLRLARLADIGGMKLSAITSRAAYKDYIDLYYILKQTPLANLLAKTKRKMPELSLPLVLKSLVYFDDVKEEKLNFRSGFGIAFSEVKSSIEKTVKEYAEKNYQLHL
ncbi:MAG: nucleotidyl transferase AbiEii/AbiGii toxin family protein [Candidatus Vogelbacteria bacterium]|nr:nucleotidyl transferase AbiEii/AbiGii toxin family protein [Candidatus Vogelbacteria bacterium]